MIRFNKERKTIPITSLMMFTGIEPTLLLASSNARADADQKTATSRAANSPEWE
jgi:hypothetical protein